MSAQRLREILEQVASGRVTVEEAVAQLKRWPFEDMGFAKVDHHRALRRGVPETILAQGKTPEEVAAIALRLREAGEMVLCTRATPEAARAVQQVLPEAVYHERARVVTVGEPEPCSSARGFVLVLCAGTADVPVAEEAAVTLWALGVPHRRVYDVGVAGLHRLLAHLDALHEAAAVIVVAGMDGALPSVVGGLTSRPVIAVPTSVGYGASFGGLAALLTMLNSCAAGVGVVNIDNGFGAARLAASIVCSRPEEGGTLA